MQRKARSTALLSAGLLAGGAPAGARVVSAPNAATADASLTAASSGSSSNEGATAGPSGEGREGQGFAQGQGRNPDEQSVSAGVEAKLKAAALKAVPGGTVVRIETDSGPAAYEAHMKRSDGSLVTVKFDKSLAVAGVEDGMGKGPDGSASGGTRHGGSGGERPTGGSGESGSPT
jgi:hypothetical protein